MKKHAVTESTTGTSKTLTNQQAVQREATSSSHRPYAEGGPHTATAQGHMVAPRARGTAPRGQDLSRACDHPGLRHQDAVMQRVLCSRNRWPAVKTHMHTHTHFQLTRKFTPRTPSSVASAVKKIQMLADVHNSEGGRNAKTA